MRSRGMPAIGPEDEPDEVTIDQIGDGELPFADEHALDFLLELDDLDGDQ